MPIYVYKCADCSHVAEFIKSMNKSNELETCPICGEHMLRDFSGNVPHTQTDYQKEIVSHSLAMHPDQIAQHRRDYPDVGVRADGCPVFDNYKTHDKYLQDINFTKMGGKRRPSTAKRTPV